MIKELVVISGKGGTGKTSLVASLAVLADNKLLTDCDVDAPDLHLLLSPEVRRRESFSGRNTPVFLVEQCDACGRCVEVCRFNALSFNGQVGDPANGPVRMDMLACEGCGVCMAVCPQNAIEMMPQTDGEWYVSDTPHGPMVHARLLPGQENSGKLVSLIRKKAKQLARDRSIDFILSDGPPGIGCPVIASLGGASLALLVIEPTVSGAHDLRRVMELVNHFKVPAVLCINKFDLNPDLARTMEEEAKDLNVPPIGRIPYDDMVTAAQMQGVPLVEYSHDAPSALAVRNMWECLVSHLNTVDHPDTTEDPVAPADR